MGSLSTWDNRRLAVIRDLVAVTALNVKLKADTKKNNVYNRKISGFTLM